MKHERWRHDPAQYELSCTIEPRWSEVDTLRHLNNSALHGLHQEVRLRLLTARIGDAFWRARGPRLLASRVGTDFLLQSHYPQPLLAAARITALDAQQLVVATGLFQDGRCVGLQTAQLHAVEKDHRIALPAPWHQALAGSAAQAPVGDTAAHALALQLDMFAQRRELDSRYADLDATGRTSELALMRSAETGRAALLRAAFAALGNDGRRAGLGLLVARVDLRLLRQAPAPPVWQLGAGVTHLGRSSLVARVALFDGLPQCHALADCVLVFVDRDAGTPVAMPDEVRAVLDRYRVAA